MRDRVIIYFLTIFFLLLVAVLFKKQVIQGQRFRQLSQKNSVRVISQKGARGRFLDRKGRVIVDNALFYDVLVTPQILDRGDDGLLRLCRKMEIPFSATKEKITKSRRFSLLPVTIAVKVTASKAMALEEMKWDIPEIIIQPHPLRRYPYGNLACHILGYLGEIDHWRLSKLADYGYKTKDIVGYTGLEEMYDYYLRQEEGGTTLEVDHRGRPVRVMGFRPPKNGLDIQLTIDLEVQKVVEARLSGRVGSVIIMDAQTGEIIALANSPNFDPSIFLKSSPAPSSYLNSADSPLLNRAIKGVYPPASVFKAVVAQAGLELSKVKASTTFVCEGGLDIGNRRFGCWQRHGAQNIFEAIANSCDVFFYHLGLLIGGQELHDYALKFGLGRPTGVDLPYEASGQVPNPTWKKIVQLKRWFDGDTANFSIGQSEFLVTPLQLTRMMAVFANRGILVTPYLVKSIGKKDVSSFRQHSRVLPLKREALEIVRQGLRDAVLFPSGTAHILSQLGVSIAGKTGTAQTPRGQSHAWFLGFFPYTQARYVICVFLEHGGSGQAACLLARNILKDLLDANLFDLKGNDR